MNFDLTLAPERNGEAKRLPPAVWRLLVWTFVLPLLTTLLVIVFLGEPVITVRNSGSAAITRVYLQGSGIDVRVGEVAPGQSVQVVVRPQGESGLTIKWTNGERNLQKGDLAYLERFGGSCASIVVNGDVATRDISDRKAGGLCASLKRILRWRWAR